MWIIRPAWSIEAAKRTTDGDAPGWVNFTVTRGPDGAVTCWFHPSLGVALATRSSVGDRRSTSTVPASPAPWFWGASPTWGAGPWSVWGGAQLLDEPGAPEEPPGPGAGAAVVGVEPPLPPLVGVEPESVDPELGEPESAEPPLDDGSPLDGAVDVVVALAGPLAVLDGLWPALAGDGSAAKTGEIATRQTTPAVSGNRN